MLVAIGVTIPRAALVAGEIALRRHRLSTSSEFLAAAAVDVNHDGRLDIVCGAFWYEAPSWLRRPVRAVEIINGRPDGYAHLPIDVNRDGWTDILTVNYRSRSIKWIEHPGASLGMWKEHRIAEPGPMETGRLVDVDGDGHLDVLPNGARFAAWWTLRYESADGAPARPVWDRYDLPRELAGHGLGYGDINGDGRADVVGRLGWAEAPEHPRRERWQFHADFDLDTASVPILAVDVDADGDTDLVWCRGHDFGTFWMEQTATSDGRRQWVRHVIDSSWSGGHAPLWVDMDGDGSRELVVGKRYLPHEGRDPGEYDPLVGYRYQFDPSTRTWHRWLLSYDDQVGFGLDPKAVDLDNDGDLDLLCAGRCGLSWLENTSVPSTAGVLPPDSAPDAPRYNDHANLLVVRDVGGSERPITTPFDWGHRRAHILAAIERVLGQLPDPYERVPLAPQWRDAPQGTGATVQHRVSIHVAPGQRVPWLLFAPSELERNGRPRRGPAIVCLDDRTSTATTSRPERTGPSAADLAQSLAALGFVCLARDVSTVEPAGDGREAGFAEGGGTISTVWANVRALDLLESLPYVDAHRIGILGHGVGGAQAILTAVFDQRVAAVAASCGAASLAGMDRVERTAWSRQLRIPEIESAFAAESGELTFDFGELLGAIAPRPLCVIAPSKDPICDARGVRLVVAAAEPIYALRRASDALRAVYPDTPRGFPDQVQSDVRNWLVARLRS